MMKTWSNSKGFFLGNDENAPIVGRDTLFLAPNPLFDSGTPPSQPAKLEGFTVTVFGQSLGTGLVMQCLPLNNRGYRTYDDCLTACKKQRGWTVNPFNRLQYADYGPTAHDTQ